MNSNAIVAFIDQHISSMLEYPHMHASSPEQLEAVFYYMDLIKDFIEHGTTPSWSGGSSYAKYLHESGCEAQMFIPVAAAAPREDYVELIKFLKGYLAKSGRLPTDKPA
jgi:hypothetical protein